MNKLKSTINKIFSFLGYEVNKKVTQKNKYLQCNNWDYQKKHVIPYLPKGGVILDIGSGHNPVPEADILADYFPEDNLHRASSLVEDRPVIICSVERLPIANKKIDFVICSHILEHVESPERAGEELGRIAKAGYIETPAYGKDIIVGTGNMHKWQIVEFEGFMHFFEYSARQREAHITSPAMEIWSNEKYHPWQDFFWDRLDVFNAMLIWKGAPKILEYRRNTSAAPLLIWKPVDECNLATNPCSLTDREIDLLTNVLASPDGVEKMLYSDGHFINTSGNAIYPIRGKKIYFEMGKSS